MIETIKTLTVLAVVAAAAAGYARDRFASESVPIDELREQLDRSGIDEYVSNIIL